MAVTVHLTWDAKSDIAYLYLRPLAPGDIIGPTLFCEQDWAFNGNVRVDFLPADGRLVGFEIEQASTALPTELLAGAERNDGRHAFDRLTERFEPVVRAMRQPGRRRNARRKRMD